MEYAYLTDTGKVREHNEDSVTIVKNINNEILMAVADGMGGHQAGEVASSIAISHIGKRFSEISSLGTKEDAINWVQEHPESMGMGTTLVTAIITNDYLLFGNIGDSSGFVLKNEKLHKITTDHTLVNLLVKSGELTEEEAKDHPRKNVLMKALGATNTVEMDVFDVETDVDGVLLCSDGLTNMLEFDQICKVLLEDLTIDEKLQKLIYKSNNRGGNDNISVAYLTKVGV